MATIASLDIASLDIKVTAPFAEIERIVNEITSYLSELKSEVEGIDFGGVEVEKTKRGNIKITMPINLTAAIGSLKKETN